MHEVLKKRKKEGKTGVGRGGGGGGAAGSEGGGIGRPKMNTSANLKKRYKIFCSKTFAAAKYYSTVV